MPKSPSKTSKKKKFNSRFPPARIKKIMQTDEEVGKVAAAVPVIISRVLEMFIKNLITETSETTLAKNAKTLSTSHIKHTIQTNKQYDFLRGLVENIADHNPEDPGAALATTSGVGNGAGAVGSTNGDPPQKRGRGRPRLNKDPSVGRRKHGESSKASQDTSEEEDDEEDNDDTDTDDGKDEGDAQTNGGCPTTLPSQVTLPVSNSHQKPSQDLSTGHSNQFTPFVHQNTPTALGIPNNGNTSHQDSSIRYLSPEVAPGFQGFPGQQFMHPHLQHPLQQSFVPPPHIATTAAYPYPQGVSLPPAYPYPALGPSHYMFSPAGLQPGVMYAHNHRGPHPETQPINLSMSSQVQNDQKQS